MGPFSQNQSGAQAGDKVLALLRATGAISKLPPLYPTRCAAHPFPATSHRRLPLRQAPRLGTPPSSGNSPSTCGGTSPCLCGLGLLGAGVVRGCTKISSFWVAGQNSSRKRPPHGTVPGSGRSFAHKEQSLLEKEWEKAEQLDQD